jgi:hypothetical protein
MATTTPNYGWDVPTSSDYVKQGAVAIETLGDDIDATLWTALGGNYPGLRLIKKQTIGTAVASVNVTSAFSATYDAYKIIVSGGVGGSANLSLRVGSPASGFFGSTIISNVSGGAPYSLGTNNQANWNAVGFGWANGICLRADLVNPFLTKNTLCNTDYFDDNNGLFGSFSGLLSNTTSYTDFTITAASGTMTGGTIYVYGYGAS